VRHIECGRGHKGNKVIYATIGLQPVVMRGPTRSEIHIMNQKHAKPLTSPITYSSTFNVGTCPKENYFAIGCADGYVGIFCANPAYRELQLAAHIHLNQAPTGSAASNSNSISGIYFVPLTCLRRFQENLVYLWVASPTSLLLGSFRVGTQGPIKWMVECSDAGSGSGRGGDKGISEFPSLINCQTLHSSLGKHTLTALHFLHVHPRAQGGGGGGEVKVVTYDTRLLLHIAEKVRTQKFCICICICVRVDVYSV